MKRYKVHSLSPPPLGRSSLSLFFFQMIFKFDKGESRIRTQYELTHLGAKIDFVEETFLGVRIYGDKVTMRTHDREN
jgi:hypothetical protein